MRKPTSVYKSPKSTSKPLSKTINPTPNKHTIADNAVKSCGFFLNSINSMIGTNIQYAAVINALLPGDVYFIPIVCKATPAE